ncbi:MAG TPA: DUF2634 domain-containing protein [Longimicrobiales bacterium]
MSADSFDFSFLPVDEDELSPDADLDAAEASALEDPLDAPVEGEAATPLGRTWYFDWTGTGRFRRHGLAPAETRGEGALIQWCMMAMHSAWLAHAVFSAEFGVERPDSPVGLVGREALIEAGDWAARLREALLVHDRIAEVDGLSVQLIEDTILVGPFAVITDEDDRVVVGPVQLREG